MKIKRVVTNLYAASPDQLKNFYQDMLGLDLLMDQGWICTFGNQTLMPVQVSIASQGGSGTPLPDLSIEVDNLDDALEKVRKFEIAIEYGPVDEPWGVRRFYIRDPLGNLLNILQHV